MIDLEAVLGEVAPEQAILLTFTLGLTQLDHAVLPVLQDHGDGRVTVLADPAGIEAAFAESATSYGPGVRYRLLPYRPPSGKPFHPKLYLVVGEKGARLVVTSANLTLYGFRENLEIVDVAGIGPEDQEDAALFVQALDFLYRLSELEPTAGAVLSADLEAMDRRLKRWCDDVDLEGWPRLLHSLDIPLMDQLVEAVPAEGIERILCVSPFYDGGRMLKELCARYPEAEVRVIGPSEGWNDLDGTSLASLSSRLSAHRLVSAGGLRRPLHGKLLALEGRGRMWTLAGSANATSAAWLSTASERRGGNVEVIVIREHETSDLLVELEETLQLEPVEITELEFDRDSLEPRLSSDAPLTFVHAEERPDGRVRAQVRLKDDALVEPHEFHVRVEGRLATFAGPARILEEDVEAWPPGVLFLEAEVDLRPFREESAPFVLWVELRGESGVVAQGRGWLERPHLLELSSRERRVQSALARMRLSRTAGEHEIESVTDALADFLSQVAKDTSIKPGKPTSTSSGGGAGSGGGEDEQPQDAVDANPGAFTLSVDEMSPHRAGSRSSHMLEILRQFGEALRRQFENPEVEEEAPPDDSKARSGRREPKKRSRFPRIRPSVHTAVHRRVTETFLEQLRSGRKGMPLRELVAVADALGWLLVRLAASALDVKAEDPTTTGLAEHGTSGEEVKPTEDGTAPTTRVALDSDEERAIRHLIELVRVLFGMAGAERGSPEGRVIDAWLSAPDQVAEALPTSVAEDFLLMTAIAALLVPHEERALGSAAGGLRLLWFSSGEGRTPDSLEERLESAADKMAQALGHAVGIEDILGIIRDSRRSLAPVRLIAQWWEPVFYIAEGSANPEGQKVAREIVEGYDGGRTVLKVIEALKEREDPPIAVADISEKGKVCGRCREGISSSALQRLFDPKHPFLQCPFCGVIIAPFDPNTDVTNRLVRALRHIEVEA